MAKKYDFPENEDTLDKLEREIRTLPPHDRAKLLVRLGLPERPASYGSENGFNIDMLVKEGVLWDHFEVADDLHKPKVIIKTVAKELDRRRGKDVEYETIDIFDSIRNNPAALGHPLILFALLGWLGSISYHYPLSTNDESSSKEYEEAKTRLERVSTALIEGAKERAMPHEYVRLYRRKTGEDLCYGVLYEAWKLLADSDIKRTKNRELAIGKIKQKLQVAGFQDSQVDQIIRFLKENDKLLCKRLSWVITWRRYDAWRLSLNQATLRSYNSRVNRHWREGRIKTDQHTPTESGSISRLAAILGDWFSLLSNSKRQ